MIAILDSSVAVKWYALEPQSEEAAALIGQPLTAPDLIRVEVGHALWKKADRGEIRRTQAIAALPHLASSVALLRSGPLAERALDLAFQLNHPIYDCFFLLLAEDLDLPLVTADVRLRQRVDGTPMEGRVLMLSDWKGTLHA